MKKKDDESIIIENNLILTLDLSLLSLKYVLKNKVIKKLIKKLMNLNFIQNILL